MKHKCETFEKFKEFQNDCGGEYLSFEFSNYLRSCGIVPQLMPPGTSQRNNMFERCNQTLLDMVWSMMSMSNLPLSVWDML